MTKTGAWQNRLARAAVALLAVAVCAACGGLLAAHYVTRRFEAALAARTPGAVRQPEIQTVEIDFFAATGIGKQELEEYLAAYGRRENTDVFPMRATLQNADGDYLIDSPVLLRSELGTQKLLVGKSGILRLRLLVGKLPNFVLVAPAGYDVLRQRSVELGTAYQPEERLDGARAGYHVVWDGGIDRALARQLPRIAAAGRSWSRADLERQLRRDHTPLRLAPPPAGELTPAEIYRRQKDAVVIVGHYFPDRRRSHATGVVLDPSGVIATAYHVVDQPAAVARGVMTSSGEMYPISEILAASKPADVALVKIEAPALQSVPLSGGDPEGSPITIISHPGGGFFSLTQGHVSRYFAADHFGRTAVRMTVTADFADGSSGAPIFNSRGALAGLVSSTRPLGDQMVARFAVPAEAIRELIREPDEP